MDMGIAFTQPLPQNRGNFNTNTSVYDLSCGRHRTLHPTTRKRNLESPDWACRF